MQLLEHAKRSKLGQWALAYLAGAWVLLQVVGFFATTYNWSPLVLRLLPVLLAFGLIITLVLAWFHGERGAQRASAAEIVLVAVLVLLGAGAAAFVAKRGHPPTATAATEPQRVEPEQASIAVLPFKNASSDKEQEFFSDGLTEELLDVLAKIDGLRVAARTSAFVFKNKDLPVDSIARALRVAHLLEGNVEKAGDRVRIRVHLVDAKSGYERWSESYDRKLTDVFQIQDEISRTVAEQLRVRLAGNAQLVRNETSDTLAHSLLLHGLEVLRENSPEARAAALDLFRKAALQDPNYAAAHASVANAVLWQAYWRAIPREEGYREARAEALRALQLDPDQTLAHRTMGVLADLYEWNFQEADKHLAQAQASSPSDGATYGSRAWLLLRLNRIDEAISAAQRATQLDPLEPATYNSLGLAYTFGRKYDKAINAYRAGLELAPRAAHIYANMAMSYMWSGRYDDALKMLNASMAIDSTSVLALTAEVRVLWRSGKRAEAMRVLDRMKKMSDVPPYRFAAIYAVLGDKEKALDYLERAVATRDDNASWIAVAQDFDGIRSDPRFQKLLERSGLKTTKS